MNWYYTRLSFTVKHTGVSMVRSIFFVFIFFLCIPSLLQTIGLVSIRAAELPRLHLEDIEYQGAFRLPATTYGTSSLNYSQGPLEYNSENHSIFIAGHTHHQNIAEFAIPEIVKSEILSELNMAGAPLQEFVSVLDRATGGNPQSINSIGGMEFVRDNDGGKLIINGYEYYDAPGDNSETTLIAENASELGTCAMDGFHTFEGGAGHTSGWISPIPREWQATLGGTHITGQSSGIPIISRTSVGPSAFAFNMETLVSGSTVPEPIPTTKLLDFSLGHPLHDDLSNEEGSNDIWTHLTRVVYGFIVPGTRTYLTIGQSGGHESGICYKCTQDNGHLCGGYCAPESDDYYHYYWMWDMNDLVAVKNGEMNSYDVRPYDYGEFPTPFATNSFGGGSFDPQSGILYLTVQKADREQGTYSNPPVVVTFSFKTGKTVPLAPMQLLLLN